MIKVLLICKIQSLAKSLKEERNYLLHKLIHESFNTLDIKQNKNN